MPSEPSSYSPPSNRASARESPEHRRRPIRGRMALNRPTSVGSARFVSSNFNQALVQRMNTQSAMPSIEPSFPIPNFLQPWVPPSNSESSIEVQNGNSLPDSSRSPGEASPAVVSGISTGDRRMETQIHPQTDTLGDIWRHRDRSEYSPPRRPNALLLQNELRPARTPRTTPYHSLSSGESSTGTDLNTTFSQHSSHVFEDMTNRSNESRRLTNLSN